MPEFHVSTLTGVIWLVVTPQTINAPAPTHYDIGTPGSVQTREYRLAKPAAQCPLYDDQGRVVGFSLNCKGSDQ